MIAIFAYKANSEDYCRGRVMARYNSDFEYLVTTTDQEAIDFIAKFQLANRMLDTGESAYKLHLIAEEGEIEFGDPRFEQLMEAAMRQAKADHESILKQKADAAAFAQLWSDAHKENEERKTLVALTKKFTVSS